MVNYLGCLLSLALKEKCIKIWLDGVKKKTLSEPENFSNNLNGWGEFVFFSRQGKFLAFLCRLTTGNIIIGIISQLHQVTKADKLWFFFFCRSIKKNKKNSLTKKIDLVNYFGCLLSLALKEKCIKIWLDDVKKKTLFEPDYLSNQI